MLSARTVTLHCGCITAVNLADDARSLFAVTVQVPPLGAELGQTSRGKHRLRQQRCMPVRVATHCTGAQQAVASPAQLFISQKSLAGLGTQPPVCLQHDPALRIVLRPLACCLQWSSSCTTRNLCLKMRSLTGTRQSLMVCLARDSDCPIAPQSCMLPKCMLSFHIHKNFPALPSIDYVGHLNETDRQIWSRPGAGRKQQIPPKTRCCRSDRACCEDQQQLLMGARGGRVASILMPRIRSHQAWTCLPLGCRWTVNNQPRLSCRCTAAAAEAVCLMSRSIADPAFTLAQRLGLGRKQKFILAQQRLQAQPHPPGFSSSPRA